MKKNVYARTCIYLMYIFFGNHNIVGMVRVNVRVRVKVRIRVRFGVRVRIEEGGSRLGSGLTN